MSGSVIYLLKFVLIFLSIFAIMFVVTLLTPKIAAKVDKIAAKIIKSKSLKPDDEVRGIYDLPEEKNKDTGEMKNGEE